MTITLWSGDANPGGVHFPSYHQNCRQARESEPGAQHGQHIIKATGIFRTPVSCLYPGTQRRQANPEVLIVSIRDNNTPHMKPALSRLRSLRVRE